MCEAVERKGVAVALDIGINVRCTSVSHFAKLKTNIYIAQARCSGVV
jgi:hypothetical protein